MSFLERTTLNKDINLVGCDYGALIVVVSLLSGCGTTYEIRNGGTTPNAAFDTSFNPVQLHKFTTDVDVVMTRRSKSYFLVGLLSNVDFEAELRKHEYHHVYFDLLECDSGKNSTPLLSGNVFKKTKGLPDDEKGDEYSYFAFIPSDYENAINDYQELLGAEPISRLDSYCIALGAGNMAGAFFKTNAVSIEF